MKILITGSNGYIGRTVAKAFSEAGWEDENLILADIADKSSVSSGTYKSINILTDATNPNLFEELGRPDVVIHLAWQDGFNHQSDAHLNNLSAHYDFLRNIVDAGCKSISIMGTMHEVGYWEGAITAETPCNPQSPYGIAKNALRQMIFSYCKGKDVSLKWLRAYYITGDDIASRSIFSKILAWESEGKETFAFTSGKNLYDFIDVRELAEQIMAASTQNEINGIINVCSGEPISLKEKVERFLQENGLKIRPEYGLYPDRPYDSPGVWGDSLIIRKILNKRNKSTNIQREAGLKVLVTGANGYIGSHVINELIKRKVDVVATDISGCNINSDAVFKTFDILKNCDSSDCFDYLGRPDVIIHLAWKDGFNHGARSHIADLSAHYRFLTNMADAGCKQLVVAGSFREYGSLSGQVREDEKLPEPECNYALAKITLCRALEIYSQENGVCLQWLRFFTPYGDDSLNNSILSKILQWEKEGKSTFPFTLGEEGYDYIHIDELASQVVTVALQSKIKGKFNLCSGKVTKLKDLVERFIEQQGLSIRPEYGKYKTRSYDSVEICGERSKFNSLILK